MTDSSNPSVSVEARERSSGLSNAARDVLAERLRQVSVKGWTPEHDDDHFTGELARAAGAYALYAAASMSEHPGIATSLHRSAAGAWPWDEASKANASTERRNLVRAGALILAEIERLDRATSGQQGRAQAAEASGSDVEDLILKCIPGGTSCDPQQVADSIRAYFSQQGEEGKT